MAGETSLSPEVLKKATEKQRKVSKKAKGFYYHAAEYQRKKQNERKNVFNKVFHGIVEPFVIHGRALKLKRAAKKYGGGGGSAVLDQDFVNKVLDKKQKLSDQDIQKFRAKAQTRAVFEQYDLTKEQTEAAKRMMSDIFNKRGKITDKEREAYEKQYGKENIDRLIKTAVEDGSAYTTTDEFTKQFNEDVIYRGLSENQLKLVKQIRRDVLFSTGFSVAKIGALIAIAANPAALAGAVGVGLSTVASGGMRIASLNKEGATYKINKLRGVEQQQSRNWYNRVMGVDWDKDNQLFQVVRAAGVGAALGFAVKFISPHVMEALQHVQHGDVQTAIADHFRSNASADIGHHGAVSAAKAATEMNVPVDKVHEHLHDLHSNTTVRFLPDTKHHDWQQLHTFTQQVKGPDGKMINEIKLSYNGVDDGIPHNEHFIDLMLNNRAGGEHVFIQNDAILAVNGPDANKLVAVYKLVNGHMEPAGYMQSANLATQMGLTQHSIDAFTNLTHAAGSPGHPGLWHGTQNASDLQTIMFRRGLYDDGAHGNGFWAMRLGGGYVRNGHFYVGASNHYFDHGLVNNNVITHYNPTSSPSFADEDTPFRSSIAEGLRSLDEAQDDALARMFGLIHREDWAQQVDNFTDYGLYRQDDMALAINELFQNRIWRPALGIIALHAGAGAGAAYLGRKRAENPGRNIPTTTGLAGLEGIALAIMPSLGATTALAYWIAKAQRMGRLRSTASRATTETKPAAPATPPTQPPSQPPAPTPVATENVESVAAVSPAAPIPAPPPVAPITSGIVQPTAPIAGPMTRPAAQAQTGNANQAIADTQQQSAVQSAPPLTTPSSSAESDETAASTESVQQTASAPEASGVPIGVNPQAQTTSTEETVSGVQPETLEAANQTQTPERVETEAQAETNQQLNSFPSAPVDESKDAVDAQTVPTQIQEAESVPETQQQVAQVETPEETLEQSAPITAAQPTVPPVPSTSIADEQKEDGQSGSPTNPPQQ